MPVNKDMELATVNNLRQPREPTNYLLTENDYYEGSPSEVGALFRTLNNIATLSTNFRESVRPRRPGIA